MSMYGKNRYNKKKKRGEAGDVRGLERRSHEMESVTEAEGPGDQEDVHRFREMEPPSS